MAISKTIKRYLDDKGVKYTVGHHAKTFTAQETAGAQHCPGDCMAKCVVVNVDGAPILCVLPASYAIDFDKLQRLMGAEEIALATEQQVADLFPEYQVGTEPPLQDLCGEIPFLVDSHMRDVKEIWFNAGTHEDMVGIAGEDFFNLTHADAVKNFAKHL